LKWETTTTANGWLQSISPVACRSNLACDALK
jgi:hypothetical protein